MERADLANGLGWGVVLWVSGCSHHCKGCHNQWTWDWYAGKEFDSGARDRLFKALADTHMGRFTVSGGDPLFHLNRQDVIVLCKEVRERFPEKQIWLYTGYTLEQIRSDVTMCDILSHIDVLIDGEFQIDKKDLSLPFRGSSNQRIIHMQKSL